MLREEVRAARSSGVLAVIRQAPWLVLMLLLTRATLLTDQSPFAIAMMTAGLAAGTPAWALWAGCILGLNPALGFLALTPALGCAVAQALNKAVALLPKRFRPGPGTDAFLGGRDAQTAAIAGLATLIPALAASQGLPYNVMMAAANAVIAACIAPVLLSAMTVRASRERLMRDEQLALMLVSALALMGIRSIPVAGPMLAPPVAAILCLIASSLGAGQGAAAGLLYGAALSFSGGDRFVGAALGLCALTAGAAGALGRWAGALAFALCNMVTLLYGMGASYGALHPAQAFAAGLLYCLLPPKFMEKVWAWFLPTESGHDPERLAARLLVDARKRVRALGQVFGELAVGYESPSDAPDERAVIGQMRARLCRGCAGCRACWDGSDGRAGRLMCDLVTRAVSGEAIEEKDELPPEVARLCRRATQIPQRLGPVLKDFSEKRRSAQARGQATSIMGKQFRQAETLLLNASGALAMPVKVDSALSRQAVAALDREAIKTREVLALRSSPGGAVTITAVKREGIWRPEEAKRAATRLSAELGLPMRTPMLPEGGVSGELCFFQAPRYTATVGFVSRAKESTQPSGDSHLAAGLPGGRVLMMLSDGMGTGVSAARESRAAVRLIRRFLAAEVEHSLAFDSVNQLLMLLGGDDMFATVDLCVLDLNACSATFSKLGGCDSFMIRKGELTRIEGGRLPMGILEDVTPAGAHLRLQPGDTLLMMTDGLFDATQDGERAWLEQAASQLSGESPQAMCEALATLALDRQGQARDDITVMAARIGKS
jgi:stage II sporulation protein E